MNESKVLGKFARLYVSKITKFGVMLRSFEEKDLEVLLPNNQVKKGTEKGDFYEVFLYKDSEDRLIATTQRPYLSLGETAVLEVKDLLLPFKEQTKKVHLGERVLVALYIDKSSRLCATMKVYDYLSCDSPYQKGDHVEGLIYEILDSFGAFVAVDNQYSALIPHNEMTRELHIGDVVKARIKEVTEEGKLTLSLQEKTKVQMGKDAELIYERLQKEGGFLPFHDKTSPEIIKREFKISKAAFKRAIGRLLKEGKIKLTDSGIERI